MIQYLMNWKKVEPSMEVKEENLVFVLVGVSEYD